jgi:hypothetical protein
MSNMWEALNSIPITEKEKRPIYILGLKYKTAQALVALTYNPNYLGGWDGEDQSEQRICEIQSQPIAEYQQ